MVAGKDAVGPLQGGVSAKDLAERFPKTIPVTPRMPAWQLAIKRAIDLTVSLVLLPLVLILGLIIGIAIKLDSPGPILYKQVRIGKRGRAFNMYKFRSMFRDAEQRLRELQHLNEASGPVFKIKKDPRITRVGALLRKTSLDELPQILNVLKGDMSLVGPRPPLPNEVEQYNDYQWGRLAVTPGITCIWQVYGRSRVSFDEWVEMDLQYIRDQSLWLDLKLLLKTIPAVLKGSGAW